MRYNIRVHEDLIQLLSVCQANTSGRKAICFCSLACSYCTICILVDVRTRMPRQKREYPWITCQISRGACIAHVHRLHHSTCCSQCLQSGAARGTACYSLLAWGRLQPISRYGGVCRSCHSVHRNGTRIELWLGEHVSERVRWLDK